MEPPPSRSNQAPPNPEQCWKAFLQYCLIGVAVVAIDGHYILTNSVFQKLVGHTEPELQQMLFSDLTDEKVLPTNHTPFADLVRDERASFKIEKHHRRNDGSLIWLKVSAILVPESHPTPPFVIALVEDVTELKKVEDAARNLPDKLFRARDDERRRVAGEMHDVTAQNVAAIIMDLRVIRQGAGVLAPEARTVLSECVSLAQQSLHEIRTFSYLLHPPLLDEVGLVSGLRVFIEGFSHRSGMSVDLEVPDSYTKLPNDLEITLFHVVQEGLTNAYRHSRSSWAKVRISVNATEISVSVENETTAEAQFRKGVVPPEQMGVGITSMQDRVQHFGGQLTFHFGQGRALLVAVLPVSRAAKATSA